jgi:hypothetical protein
METLMRWLTLGLLIWLAGAGMHWWRGPLAVVSDVIWHVRSRHENPSSDPDPTSDDDADDSVVTTPHDPPRARRLERPLDGPRDLDELRAEAGIEDDDEDDLPPRRDWVAARLADGWRATDIDEEGADLYDVSTRTIARDREALAARRGRGTMRGPAR